MMAASQNTFVMVYIDETEVDNDVKKLSRVFDWAAGAGVSVSLNPGSVSPMLINFDEPSSYAIDIYGVAREGST